MTSSFRNYVVAYVDPKTAEVSTNIFEVMPVMDKNRIMYIIDIWNRKVMVFNPDIDDEIFYSRSIMTPTISIVVKLLEDSRIICKLVHGDFPEIHPDNYGAMTTVVNINIIDGTYVTTKYHYDAIDTDNVLMEFFTYKSEN